MALATNQKEMAVASRTEQIGQGMQYSISQQRYMNLLMMLQAHNIFSLRNTQAT
jgi:hypothetical protein